MLRFITVWARAVRNWIQMDTKAMEVGKKPKAQTRAGADSVNTQVWTTHRPQILYRWTYAIMEIWLVEVDRHMGGLTEAQTGM